ncbi:MAG: putative toxin-antitoxin system toxin component, PIN family [Nitrospinae bacterium]|nr:putative toxin-antitoxin system toxin component, PIN family [Nitrospinota bacterium]
MRVFFDTNVLVSAFTASQGTCFKVFEITHLSHTVVIGEFVLAELERILIKKSRIAAEDIKELLEELRRKEVVPIPQNPSVIPVCDPDDAYVLASALEARADILVTGDKDLLEIGDKAGIKIVDPRTFLEMLEREK